MATSPTSYRAHPFALLGLLLLGTWPLILCIVFEGWQGALWDGYSMLNLATATWTAGVVLWLSRYRFTITDDALIRVRLGSIREVSWERVRSVRKRAMILAGTRFGVGLLQATRWELIDRRGGAVLWVPSVMRRARLAPGHRA